MERLTETHLQTAKRVLRYVKGTISFGVFYKKGGTEELVGYTYSDYVGDQNDRKSISGYVFTLSSGAISWSSKKQPVVTFSTTEAEFIAASSACQAVQLRRILEQLNHGQYKPTVIHCDNVSAIKLSKNPIMHGRSKHIDVRFHFLRNIVKDEVVELVQCSTQEQVELVQCSTQEQIADILTKPLRLEVFVKMRDLMANIHEIKDLRITEILKATDNFNHAKMFQVLAVYDVCFRENRDIFAWSPSDIPDIDPKIACHKLHVDLAAKLVIQKRRHFAPEQVAIIEAEIDKLLEVGFIEEVAHSAWLANIMLVKKKEKGKWRVCVDYTNLNKACPNDPYPLPRIDLLVDSTSGNQLRSFLDAYSGYNQIVMYEPNKEKTAFVIEQGTYCYKVMPYGLKNA
nr:uncharacterized protein LOC103444468 [Malus domestica]